MGARRFKVAMILLGATVWLSSTVGVGMAIGLFLAFTIAFFLAPLVFALAAIGGETTHAVSPLVLAGVVLALLVALSAWRALRRWRQGRADAARLALFQAALLAALPLIAKLSGDALAAAWP